MVRKWSKQIMFALVLAIGGFFSMQWVRTLWASSNLQAALKNLEGGRHGS